MTHGITNLEAQTHLADVKRAYMAGWIDDEEMRSYFDGGYYTDELDTAFRQELFEKILRGAKLHARR